MTLAVERDVNHKFDIFMLFITDHVMSILICLNLYSLNIRESFIVYYGFRFVMPTPPPLCREILPLPL